MLRYHYIYLPGLGDNYDGMRRAMTLHWQLWPGVSRTVVPMLWSQNESLETKQQRVKNAIEQVGGDAKIVLVGESAGGSVAITMASRYPEISVVTICGKNTLTKTIGDFYRRRFNEFVKSVEQSEALAPRVANRLLVVRSSFDHLIPRESTYIDGANERVVAIPGHLASIGWIALTQFGKIHAWSKQQ